ncbi:dolichyl-diphosphooligosaccharide--protein glycosyltransferase subunit STT3 [Alphaproteobacteria bacterium]|nr:dolichyl-diphosphooligosaccharide--protein glycosyltransferase subunit STT3 [Alphaproteobacteria bacterium]
MSGFFNRWQTFHAAFIARHLWLQPLSGRVYIAAACVFVLGAAAINYDIRDRQYAAWKAHPDITHLGDMPLFSIADAPYFLGIAAELKRGKARQTFEQGRSVPNQVIRKTPFYDHNFDRWHDAPLLSVAIAMTAKDAGRAAIAKAGHLLIPVAAAITAIMIAFAFGVAGYWLEGAVAALGGGLSFAYLSRSAAGRIDTDQLNLGFFYLLFGLAFWAGTARGKLAGIAAVAAMGICAYLFNWWYGKPELIVMPVIAFVWLRLVVRRDWRGAVFGAVIILALSDISMPNSLASSYIQPYFNQSGFLFPNGLETVSEVQSYDILQILLWLTSDIWLGWFCALGLLLLALRHPVIAIAYAPTAGFILFNAVLGNWAIFYAAPAFWFGGAWLFITICRFALPHMAPTRFAPGQGVAGMMAAVAIFGMTYLASPTHYMPQPSFPKPVMSAFALLKDRTDDPVIASWWDYGYASRFLNGAATLHDGGGSKSGVTHFFARAMVTDDLHETAAILKFLVRDGRHLIDWYDGDADGFYQLIKARQTRPTRPIFLVLTGEMAGWMQAITKIASWDIDRGQWQDSQSRFADSSYLKLFHHGETADGLFELVYDDYPQVRIFRLSNRASVN